jgi:hypothetical protein
MPSIKLAVLHLDLRPPPMECAQSAIYLGVNHEQCNDARKKHHLPLV